jgi:hypothetical protein
MLARSEDFSLLPIQATKTVCHPALHLAGGSLWRPDAGGDERASGDGLGQDFRAFDRSGGWRREDSPIYRKSRGQPEEIEADLLVTGGTLVDGTDARPLEDAAVAVEGNRIVAVGKSDSLRVADGARIVDVNGGSILPGLVNTHVHSRYVTLEETRAWTRDGVTTVLDLGGS